MAIPAICIICERRISKAGGKFVQFKIIDPKEIAYNSDISEKFGHPFGNRFFCDDHTGLAYRYKHMTWNEAEPLIKRDFENGDIPKVPIRHGFLHKVFGLITKN